jgi:hypothetical protein
MPKQASSTIAPPGIALHPEWCRTTQAAELLGKPTDEALRHWARKGLRKGFLKLGKHLKYEDPTALRPTYLFNIEKCKQV